MMVTVHRPRILVEEYELPSGMADLSDSALIGQLHALAPESSAYVDQGRAYVAARGPSDVATIGQRLAEARDAVAQIMNAATDAAVAACEAGQSERSVAEALGVDRETVRAWRGKVRA